MPALNPSNRFLWLAIAIGLFLCRPAFACQAYFHSIVQPNVSTSTAAKVTYTCWAGTAFCKIFIVKDGETKYSGKITQGSFMSATFDYGSGDITFKIKAYLGTKVSATGYTYSVAASDSETIEIYASDYIIETTTYTYDGSGRLEEVERADDSGSSSSTTSTTTYSYDDANNRKTKVVTE